MNKNIRGISMLVLVITIVVVLILSAAVILGIMQSGVLDSAKKAKFMNDFRNVEEGVNIYTLSSVMSSNNHDNIILPTEGEKLTFEEKDEIVINVPTLKAKIEELNPGETIYDRNLYWIDEDEIGAKLSSDKQEKGYIIDADTKQIYDYNGDFFDKLRWHTLDSGVDEASVLPESAQEELWNGWIKLTLYYPSDSTERKWRLGAEGELRADPMLMWQNYTGPITIPLDRIKDVWIKYKIDNKEVTIPPAGTLLVDIVPDKTGSTKVEKVSVTINYDETATLKEYRIGDSGWITYEGPFTVTENCIIEARAKKTENIFNVDGSLLLSRDIIGSDMIYIGNIGQIESDLPAPTITRLDSQSSEEKARVKIDYPSKAAQKVYILNSGAEIPYTSEISVGEWGTYIVAYYYDENGEKSKVMTITIDETPTPPEPLKVLEAPIIVRLDAKNDSEKARVKIIYPVESDKSIYTINHSVENYYTDEISIESFGTTITAYYYDIDGEKSKISKMYIGETPTPPEPDDVKIPKTEPPPTLIRLDAQNLDEKARVKIEYPENASRKVYKINYGEEQVYTGEISIENWGTSVIAYYYDVNGFMSKMKSIVIDEIPTPEKDHEPDPPYEPETPLPPTEIETDKDLPAPSITRLDAQNSDEKARIHVTYPAEAVRKVYTVNYGSEIEYMSDIKIIGWNTVIKAYYYDSKGKKSKEVQIRVDGKDPEPPTEIPVYVPESVVEAPTINLSPSSGIVTSVTVSVIPKVPAEKVYIKIGEYSDYKEYTAPVVVNENTEIYAYYRALTGEKSLTAKARVNNIKPGNKPYLTINALPYPWPGSRGVDKVNISITTSDANKVEYSEDGIVYKAYTVPFTVIKNERIYARATNTFGVTESYIDITNIGQGQLTETPPEPIKKLGININADPDPAISENRVAKVKITIEYDSRATEKYYSIGKYGELKTYTGSFDVTSNCTIYAYANGENAQGDTSKIIDNILNGISDPVISTIPASGITSSKVTVNIKYDKYATVKKYSINGGTLNNYTQEFDVTENNTKIYAYSENAAGQKSSSEYLITNIISEPPVFVLDKGSYYLLKLNYPESSKGQEYKWKESGDWKTYKEAGILLIKPQYKDTVIKNGSIIKIEDENGNKIDFKGDYYLIDVPISELSENIFMRWDRVPPTSPQILIEPTGPAKQVSATIVFDHGLIKRQYRIMEPDGSLGEWKDYTSPITITKNNTIIYAKGMDDSEVWSQETIYKVVNIDEIQPEIKLTANLTAAQQKINVQVNVTDNIGVGKIKWAKGMQPVSYFATSGTEIINNATVEVSENGYYTFYGEDKVGNTQIYTLNVTNIDLSAPYITITSNPESTIGISKEITIDYDDAVTKQYKVGANNSTWSNYSGTFTISSYTVISNNWKNADGTVTVYAKGKDIAGNEIVVEKKITNLDVDMPSVPIINTQSGYPIITTFGIKFESGTTIDYANRSDIDNYYSTDSGVTWKTYTGEFNFASGTIIAKSVKKNSGLTISVNKTIVTPSDALPSQAYDNNTSTAVVGDIGATTKYMLVDSSMYNQKISVNCSLDSYNFGNAGIHTASARIEFLNISNQIIITSNILSGTSTYTIPFSTKWIRYIATSADYGGYNIRARLYELQGANDPIITATNMYMLLTYNQADAIREPYQNITISYYPTSVQRLYRIGTTGDWLNYSDQPIRVNNGQTIYAKGIDQYGVETRITSSYSVNMADALSKEAYDMNTSTLVTTSYMGEVLTKYMDIDQSMQENQVKLICSADSNSGRYAAVILYFMDSNNQDISSVYKTNSFNGLITIPTNAKKIRFVLQASYYTYGEVPYPLHARIYDIYPANW